MTAKEERIIEILQHSFKDNKSVKALCGHSPHKLRFLMKYAVRTSRIHGKSFLSEDGNTCALILFKNQQKSTLSTVLWDLLLAFRVIGLYKLRKILDKEKKIKQYHPNVPFYYLWFIGTIPEQQGKGQGTKLIKSILEEAKQTGKQVYLETSTLSNLSWYKQLGFEQYAKIDVGYALYLFRK